MAAIVWDKTGEHFYETGVDHGVLYLYHDADTTNNITAGFGDGVAWNGLTAVNESPSGAEATPLYADNIKYLNLMSAEEYACSIEAYTYPDEFEECDGSAELVSDTGVYIGQQPRKLFGLCYRTLIGDDVHGSKAGYKLHLVYNCQASPSEKSHATVNDSPDAVQFSWDVNTTPVEVSGGQPTATLVIDSTKIPSAKLTAIENLLYGTQSTEPSLPYPNKIAEILTTP